MPHSPIQVRDAYLSADQFQFERLDGGLVQLSFGPTHVALSLDAAYDLQYRLAAFLAHEELQEFPDEESEDDAGMSEAREMLNTLMDAAQQSRAPRRLDS